MIVRYLIAVVAGCIVLLAITTAMAGTRPKQKLELDSSVRVGDGVWLYSGRVVRCGGSAVRLVGVRSDGTKKELDWTLPSDRRAWAVAGKRAGFKREFVAVRANEKCRGDKVRVFRR